MPTFNLCLRRLTALTPLTTVLLLYFLVFLKPLKLSFPSDFSSLYLVSTSSLIVSMVSVRSAQLAIFLLFLLTPGHPLLAVSGKLFAVALDNISKAFDRVWQKSLLSKLPSYGFYPSFSTFISSFLSGRSISAVVDGYCSKPKYINSGVPQGSVLSPTLYLLFSNDHLSITDCPSHSYADDSTLHYSITFKSRPSQTGLDNDRLDATERLASDFSIISDWGRRNLVSFNALKTQFLHLSTRLDSTTFPSSSLLYCPDSLYES